MNTTSSSSLAKPTASFPPTIPSKHYVPRDRRSATYSIYEIDEVHDIQRVKRNRRIDPTRELVYTPIHWEQHKSVYRRWRHLRATFDSSPFQRLLFPDLFASSLMAAGLTYFNEFAASDAMSQIWMEPGSFAAGTTAIAILTGFRLNGSYERYTDGRKLVGKVATASRNLASTSLMWVISPKDRDRMMYLIKAYSVALTYHVNAKGAHHGILSSDPNFDQQVYAEYHAEMKDIFLRREEEGNHEDFVRVCDWFRAGDNVPLGIASLMRCIIIRNHEQKDALNRELDVQVQMLVTGLGGCERIQKTPIPTSFTRHASRLLCVWSITLPFVLYPACGPVFTLPMTVAISYSIMAIEDIGVQLEEPFNILPLRQFTDAVYGAVDFIVSAFSDGNDKDVATTKGQ